MEVKILVVLLVVIVSIHAEPFRGANNQPTFPKQSTGPYAPSFGTPDWSGKQNRDSVQSMLRRFRRSPEGEDNKRGSVVLSGSHTKGQFGGPSQNSARVDYNHNLWRGKNGASIDANTHYQRNWGGGPRQDYGGGIRGSIPFGRR